MNKSALTMMGYLLEEEALGVCDQCGKPFFHRFEKVWLVNAETMETKRFHQNCLKDYQTESKHMVAM